MVEFRTQNYWEDDPRRNKPRPQVVIDSNGNPTVITPTPPDLNPPQPQQQPHPDDAWANKNWGVSDHPDTNNTFMKTVLPMLAPG
ncbi:MAG TPA: hypothetical protein VIY48_13465, partial [Candidatus Paceibacterota bacterium]